jgi:hypothetical protein
MKSRLFALALLLPVVTFPEKKPPKQGVVNVQKTSLSRDHELQLGQQAAAQVEKEMEVVKVPRWRLGSDRSTHGSLPVRSRGRLHHRPSHRHRWRLHNHGRVAF